MPDSVLLTLVIFGCVVSLVLLFKLFSCAHAWELVDKIEFPPYVEEVARLNWTFTGHLPARSFEKVIELAIRCPKCGALRFKRIRPNY